jgi:membrane protein YdbS with pleckstrin-like domain
MGTGPNEAGGPYNATAGQQQVEVGAAGEAPAALRALHPAVRKVWLLEGLFTAGLLAVFTIVAAVVWMVKAEWSAVPIVIGVVLVALELAYAVLLIDLRYRAWRYAVRPHDVLVCYGVIWRTRRCVPRLRIQHVDIEAGPINRMFGLVQLSLFTAGTVAAVATIPGLRPEEAEALREALLAGDESHD